MTLEPGETQEITVDNTIVETLAEGYVTTRTGERIAISIVIGAPEVEDAQATEEAN